MALLRIVTASADAVAALLLYSAIVGTRGDRLAGACAVAIYHLLPLDFGVLAVGNLTNAFGQSVSVGALAMMASPALRVERRWLVAAFTAIVTAAFLSHTSTFAILSVACALTAVLFWWRGGPALRSPAIAVGAGVAIAAALAVASTTRTSSTRTGRSSRASAARPPPRRPMPAAGASRRGWRRCRVTCISISASRPASSQPGEASLCGGGALPTGSR